MARASDPTAARLVARRIVARLRDHGHAAYFAGGCVRDELLGLHPTDFDVATDAPPQRIRELFPRSSEVGAAFGVILVYEQDDAGRGVSVEVATFRSDGPYSDARRPDVVHFSDAPSDAARRDFTINALFLDPLAPPSPAPSPAPASGAAAPPGARPPIIEGRVIDYVGGVDDLRRRTVRAVGDPDARLKEDHLRALRAVRFAARLDFEIEPGTAGAIARQAVELRGVSRERIGEELRRMLVHPRRARAVELLDHLGLTAPVLQAGAEEELRAAAGRPGRILNRLRDGAHARVAFATALGAWALDRAGGLAASLARRPDESKAFASGVVRQFRPALCLSNDESRELSDVVEGFDVLVHRWDAMRVSNQKRAAGNPAFFQTMLVITAADDPRADRIWSRYKELQHDGVGINPAPLVTGDDLVAAGVKPGPSFKRALDETYDAQLEGRVRDASQALELARRLCV